MPEDDSLKEINRYIKVMQKDNLLREMNRVIAEIQRIDQENPTGPNEKGDPRIDALLTEAEGIQNELDPIMRELYRDNPARLAEWDEIMHMCDDLPKEDDSAPAKESPSRKG